MQGEGQHQRLVGHLGHHGVEFGGRQRPVVAQVDDHDAAQQLAGLGRPQGVDLAGDVDGLQPSPRHVGWRQPRASTVTAHPGIDSIVSTAPSITESPTPSSLRGIGGGAVVDGAVVEGARLAATASGDLGTLFDASVRSSSRAGGCPVRRRPCGWPPAIRPRRATPPATNPTATVRAAIRPAIRQWCPRVAARCAPLPPGRPTGRHLVGRVLHAPAHGVSADVIVSRAGRGPHAMPRRAGVSSPRGRRDGAGSPVRLADLRSAGRSVRADRLRTGGSRAPIVRRVRCAGRRSSQIRTGRIWLAASARLARPTLAHDTLGGIR